MYKTSVWWTDGQGIDRQLNQYRALRICAMETCDKKVKTVMDDAAVIWRSGEIAAVNDHFVSPTLAVAKLSNITAAAATQQHPPCTLCCLASTSAVFRSITCIAGRWCNPQGRTQFLRARVSLNHSSSSVIILPIRWRTQGENWPGGCPHLCQGTFRQPLFWKCLFAVYAQLHVI